MADDSAGDALDPVPGVETLASKVAALEAARGGDEDVGCCGGRLAPVNCSEGVWRTRFGAVVR